jgi:hypothetical protein
VLCDGALNRNRLLRKSGGAFWCAAASARAQGIAVAIALLVAGSAVAQEVQPEAPRDRANGSAPAAGPTFAPGFVDALGRWLGESKATLDSQLKNTQDALGGIGTQATGAIKDAAGAAQQATGAVVGLPGARVITGRQLCPAASNGAPDCGPAADALCQANGFGSGRGLEVASTQRCSARIWRSRANPADGPCGTETFVARAVCQ